MSDNDNLEHSLEQEGDTLVAEENEIAEPRQFKVFLLNDDYTTMDFVVSILESVFMKSPSEAVQIMMKVHKQGQGLCGIYPRQIAETKIGQVHHMAEVENYPLRCTMEEV